MRRPGLAVLICLLSVAGAVAVWRTEGASRAVAVVEEVKVATGRVSGVLSGGVRVYKGIPYAAPPVGEWRWRPPQPAAAWDGVRDGSEYGPDCPQAEYPRGSLFYSPPRRQSEDCLCLNVWTAAGAGEKRPVMVWIHGGALTRGSGANSTYDGAVLARKGVVVVTINYRLGVLGYYAHPELTVESARRSSGNYGLLDQLAALEWVRKNIGAFGGDASKVTIFGESAGAWSVNALVATPLGKGLFHRAIGQSGGVFGAGVTLEAAERMGVGLAKKLKAESLADLRGVPVEKLVEAANGMAGLRTGLIVDGWALPREIRAIFAAGAWNDVPVIVGSNANEMTSLTAPATIPQTIEDYRQRLESQYRGRSLDFDRFYPVAGNEAVPDAYLGLLRDVTFTVQMRTWARMTAKGRSKAWWYYFTHAPPIPNSSYMGAFHAAEIAYVFGNIGRFGLRPPEADRRLSELMTGYWVNFALRGDPNGPGLPVWPVYDAAEDDYLELGPTVRPGKRLLREQLDFIEKIR